MIGKKAESPPVKTKEGACAESCINISLSLLFACYILFWGYYHFITIVEITDIIILPELYSFVSF